MNDLQIVLVEPSHPGNIGAAARAMKTMGLSSLRLVNPLRFPDPQADWRAAGAVDVLRGAQLFATLEDAVSDRVVVAAASARERHVSWPSCNAEELAQHLTQGKHADEPACVVFGRESDGLTNEELEQCQVQVRIPSHPDYRSLNLAMAVQVVSYEIYKVNQELETNKQERILATSGEFDQFFAQLVEVLKQSGFYDPKSPRIGMPKLRRLFSKVPLEREEVSMLRGILSHIQRAIHLHPSTEMATTERQIH